MASWFSGLLASAGTICAAGILILSMLYTKGSSIFLKLDSILSQRLSFSQKGMEVYGFSIFGQYIPMQGNGGSTETPLNYFFLDSSYISCLIYYVGASQQPGWQLTAEAGLEEERYNELQEKYQKEANVQISDWIIQFVKVNNQDS